MTSYTSKRQRTRVIIREPSVTDMCRCVLPKNLNRCSWRRTHLPTASKLHNTSTGWKQAFSRTQLLRQMVCTGPLRMRHRRSCLRRVFVTAGRHRQVLKIFQTPRPVSTLKQYAISSITMSPLAWRIFEWNLLSSGNDFGLCFRRHLHRQTFPRAAVWIPWLDAAIVSLSRRQKSHLPMPSKQTWSAGLHSTRVASWSGDQSKWSCQW